MKQVNLRICQTILTLMLGLFLSVGAYAQNITVKGHVKDALGGVIGANVVEKGNSTNGTITDLDGNFTLTVPQGATLVVSFIGYKTQEVAAAPSVIITLQDDAELLGEATKEELKSIHKLIKKVSADIEAFSYNTSISAFMICVNELTALKCRNKAVLSDLVVLIAPFAPHLAEELWEVLGHTTSVCDAQWPLCNEEYLKEDTVKYTISFNGKARFTMEFPADADNDTIQQAVMNEEQSQKWIEGKTPKKVIIVPKKIVNIVL